MATAFPVPFGKYLLTDLIAMGGMAEIYRAKIFGVNGFEKQMVVKRILPKYAQNASFVQMFVDEAKILVSLTHGNIVPVYELGEVGGNYYIAMEYAEGLTALDLLRECFVKARSLSVPQALYIAAEVAKGLGYAHNRPDPATGEPLGIVHRDLNPRNIVISPAGEVKILDFGIARSSAKKHQTGSGIIKGTPGYMAPEQVMGHTVDARADQYGLAIILHELLTVRRLLSAQTAAEHRALLQEGPLPHTIKFRPEIPASVDAAVMKALSTRPEDRFASVLDFEDALRAEIARMGAHVTSRSLAATIAEIRALPPADEQPEVAHKTPAQPPPPPPATNPAMHPVSSMPPVAVEGDFQLTNNPGAPAPTLLPSLPVATMSTRPQTQVLASNQEVGWAKNIGADAELLALAASSGFKSKTPQRLVLGGLGLALVLGGGWGATHPEELKRMVGRAQSGKAVVVGTVTVKSKPSGALVLLDGQDVGKTNMRLEQVDVELPHSLVIRFEDGKELTKALDAAAFGPERKLEVMFDTTAPAEPVATPTPGKK